MGTANPADLDRSLGIPGVARVTVGNGGLTRVQVTHPGAAGEIYLHGAHLTSWKPAGKEDAFFLSPNSLWQDGHAIRGGVPICFPWFGDKADDPHAPAHGFVRTKEWTLDRIAAEGNTVAVEMSTGSDAGTRQWYPAEFRLMYRATFGVELVLELIMSNMGDKPLQFEEALHAYHNVGDATQASVGGLDGIEYLDKMDSYRRKKQDGDVTITRETDRVYLDTEHALELKDPVLQRRIEVHKENSRTTVVWNPWAEKSQGVSDLGPEQWKRMLCIETSNVGDFAIQLAPRAQHIMRARIGLA